MGLIDWPWRGGSFLADANFLSIGTPRLTLRRLSASDLPGLVAYRSLPEVARYQDWETFTRSDGERLIAEMSQRHPDEPGRWSQFAIVRAEDNALIGDCGFVSPSEDHRQAEVGITVCPSVQNQGYATEALACLLDYLFFGLHKHRVQATTDARNAPAASLFLRLGFRREGHFLQNVWFKGEWGDEFSFGLLRSEWRSPPD